MRFEGTDNYVATDDLMMAVNAAITLERPLLIKGEPGTGKTMLAEEVAQALDILARLRLRGIHLSIDDFGTGFSMMHQLKRIPASEIKIDRGFVAAMETDHSAEVIVRKTTEIGHELRMKVVAEGVETQMQYQLLKKLNCDIAQGYLFARPMSLNALFAWRECSLVKTA